MKDAVPRAYVVGQKLIESLSPGGSRENAVLLNWIDGHFVTFAEKLWAAAPFDFEPEGEILYGHFSENSALEVDGYPYGGQRTQIRFWLEHNKARGQRFVTQTLNPKTGRWNAPKASTYDPFLVMFREPERGHITSARVGSSMNFWSSVRALGLGLTKQHWKNIASASAQGANYALAMLNENKKGKSGWLINGVEQAVRPGQENDNRLDALRNALQATLAKQMAEG